MDHCTVPPSAATSRAEAVGNMRSCPQSGFRVDQSLYVSAGDRAGIERPVRVHDPLPVQPVALVRVTETGQVIYKAEKGACRAFADPQRDEPTWNTSVFWDVPRNHRFPTHAA